MYSSSRPRYRRKCFEDHLLKVQVVANGEHPVSFAALVSHLNASDEMQRLMSPGCSRQQQMESHGNTTQGIGNACTSPGLER
jgi:hypothetical protein